MNHHQSAPDRPRQMAHEATAHLACAADSALDRLEGLIEHQRRFAADAAHELRTPLAALRLCLEEALLHPGDVDSQAALTQALRSAERLQEAVVGLLSRARLADAAA